MCTVLCPLCGIRQKWQRKLQLGCRRTGNDARLRGDDDAVRAVHLLRCRLGFRSRCSAPDLYQNEHRRGRRGEVYRITCRCVPLHHWCFNRVPCFLRLPHIGG